MVGGNSHLLLNSAPELGDIPHRTEDSHGVATLSLSPEFTVFGHDNTFGRLVRFGW